jgi:hypothetical protein
MGGLFVVRFARGIGRSPSPPMLVVAEDMFTPGGAVVVVVKEF